MALYRKYRPATFAEVVGQEHVTDPLSTALDTGRISHAYLFSGPRGCGKTSSARILARSLNCVEGPTSTPCGVCSSCVALGPGGPGNLDVIELDAASHGGVDDTRELRDRAFYAPAESRYRVFIVDEAHMVTTAGFNALLKIVEEPPAHLIFVFATTEPDKVLPTIRSRTHHYPFRLLPPATMRGLLGKICDQEGVQVEEAVYPLVIRAGGGSPRDSLSVLDQLLAGAGPEGVTYPRAVSLLGVTDIALIDDAVEALADDDGAALFGVIDRVVESGHDPRRFATDLLERLRDLILMRAVPDAIDRGLVAGPGDVLDRMRAQADRIGPATLTRYAELLHEGLGEMRGATAPRLLLEVIAARMLLPSAADTESAALQRLERIERRLAGGALPPAATSSDSGAGSTPAGASAAAQPAGGSASSAAQGTPRRRGAEALAALRAEKTGGPTTSGATPPTGDAPTREPAGADRPNPSAQAAAPSGGASAPGATATPGASAGSDATASQSAAVRHPELGPVSGGPAAAVPLADTAAPAANPAGTQSSSAAADYEKARETLLMLVGYASARAVSEPQWTEKLTTWAARLGALTPDNGDAINTVLSEDAAALRDLMSSAPAVAHVAPIVERAAAPADRIAESSTATKKSGSSSSGEAVAEAAPGSVGVASGAPRPSGSPEHAVPSATGPSATAEGQAGASSAAAPSPRGQRGAEGVAEADQGAGNVVSDEADFPTGFAFDPASEGVNDVAAEGDSSPASAAASGNAAELLSVDAATAISAGAVDQSDLDDGLGEAVPGDEPEMSAEPEIFAAADAESVAPAAGENQASTPTAGSAVESSRESAPAPGSEPPAIAEAATTTGTTADALAPAGDHAGAVPGQAASAEGVESDQDALAETASTGTGVDAGQSDPAAADAAPAGAVLQEVEAAWADIKGRAREFGPRLPALLMAASVARVEGNTVVLAHPHEALAQRLSEPSNVETLRSTMRAVLGRDHDVRWEVGGAPQAAPGGRGKGGGAGAAGGKKAPPKFSRPSQAKGAVVDAPAPADTAGWGSPGGSETRSREGSAASSSTPPDDDIPLPDGPDLPDDPGPSDYSPVGYDGVPPASTEEEEREMLAAAAQPVAPGDRRDPDEVALELLKAELGATPMEG